MPTDPLLEWRDEFPILRKYNYLINNSLGAMPHRVYDSLTHYADMWAEHGVSAWGIEWFDLNRRVGNKIAPLMGAPEDSVLIHQNASIANSILFGALDFSETTRDKVVITDMDFPGDIYVLRRWLPDHMRVEMVTTDDGIGIDTQKLLDAIDETTRLVSISHVLFRSAYIMPAQAIVEKAHRVGAPP
jgi:kynureninase